MIRNTTVILNKIIIIVNVNAVLCIEINSYHCYRVQPHFVCRISYMPAYHFCGKCLHVTQPTIMELNKFAGQTPPIGFQFGSIQRVT